MSIFGGKRVDSDHTTKETSLSAYTESKSRSKEPVRHIKHSSYTFQSMIKTRLLVLILFSWCVLYEETQTLVFSLSPPRAPY